MARVRIGDIIEIDGADHFLYYAQYTHQHPVFGSLLRVYNLRSRAGNLLEINRIVSSDIAFSVFYPLRQSINRDIFRVVGNAPLDERISEFPVFRDGHVDPTTGETNEWWLWDGTREWFVGPLEQPDRYPLRQVVNDAYLRELVQSCVQPTCPDASESRENKPNEKSD